MKVQAHNGFTLIELLVVISIIGLLSSILLTSVNNARMQARDAQRLSNAVQIRKALELYLLQNNSYPFPESEGTCGGWDTSQIDGDGDGVFFIPALVTAKIITKMPVDPQPTSGCAGYFFYKYGAGSGGCENKPFYVLGILNLEKVSSGNHPGSPGWSCPGRNWNNEFEWVTGGYEE